MAKELKNSRIILKEPVTSITQNRESAVLTSESGKTYNCKKVILAIPPSQLGNLFFLLSRFTVKTTNEGFNYTVVVLLITLTIIRVNGDKI